MPRHTWLFASVFFLPLAVLAAEGRPEGATLRLGDDPSRALFIDYNSVISPNGESVATLDQHRHVIVREVGSGKLQFTAQPESKPWSYTWTRQGTLRLAFAAEDRLVVEDWSDARSIGLSDAVVAALRDATAPFGTRARSVRRALSPDGRHVAVQFTEDPSDSLIRVFTPKPGIIYRLAEPDFTIDAPGCSAITFSSNGESLLAIQPFASEGGRVVAYDLMGEDPSQATWTLDIPPEKETFIEHEGQKIPVFKKGRPSEVMTVDGDVVVVMFPYGECEFEVWDGPIAQKLHSGKLPLYSHPGSAEPGILALSPDGQRLAVSRRESNGLVGGTVYDLRSGREVTKLSPSPNIPRGGLVFTPDGERILRGYQRWNARTGEDITTSLGHRGPILGLAITEDGKTVVTSGHDLTVRGWDPDSGKEKWTTSFPFSVTLRRVDANHVVAKEWANWPISLEKPLVDMNTGTATTLPGDMGDEKVLKLGSTEHKVRDELIMISPDGKTAITLDRSKPSLSVWDWPQGTRRNTLPIDPPKDYRIDDVDGLTVSPDGTDLIGLFWYPTVAVHTGSGLGPHGISCLEQWNLSTGERTTRRVVGAGRSDRWCSNLARHLLSNGKEITDARSGEVVLALSEAEWQSGRRWHDCMWALSADGNTLVSCNGRGLGRGDICWYDLRTRNPKRKAGDLDEPVREVAFLPDGRLVSAGQSAYVWAADR